MSGMSKPVWHGATIVLGVLLAVAVVAGLMYGDDLHELFESNESQSATERVQMQGVWLGMRLSPANNPAEFGQPTSAKGVRVVEISETYGWRARQSGLIPGDILLSAGGKKIGGLADLDSITKNLAISGPVPLEVLRWGQPITLVLPALPPTAQPTAAQVQAPAVQAPMPAQYTPTPAAVGGTFYCPVHRQSWQQGQVHPHYRCPLCYGALSRVQ